MRTVEVPWFRVFGDGLAVDFNFDGPVDNFDVVGEPLVVADGGFIDVSYGVEGTGFFEIGVGVVDLSFIASGGPPAILISCVEIDAGVGTRGSHEDSFQFEIFEGSGLDGAGVEKVASSTMEYEFSVMDFAGIFVFRGCPAVKVLAIEQLIPSVFIREGFRWVVLRVGEGLGLGGEQNEEEGLGDGLNFHILMGLG